MKPPLAAVCILAALLLGGRAIAQEDLAAQLVKAAGQEDWGSAFQAAGLDRAPIGALLDAASAVLDGQPSHFRSRIATLLEQRADAVEDAWHREPAQRGRRAVAFAAVRLDWVGRYAEGSPEERFDLDSVAEHLDAGELIRQHADSRDERRAAAEHLLRLAARGERARGASVLAPLRSREPADPMTLYGVLGNFAGSAFVLGPAIGDEDRLVRARALHALAQRLSLPVPESLAAALRDDPVDAVRLHFLNRESHAPLHDEDLPRLLTAIERGDYLPGITAERARTLSPAARAKLTQALLDAGVRQAVAQPTLPNGTVVLNTNAALLAAVMLGGDAFLTVLGRAENETDPRVVAALAMTCLSAKIDAEVAPRAAALVWHLLDREAGPVGSAMAQLLARLAEAAPAGELRSRLAERALAVAKARVAELAMNGWLPSCTGDWSSGWPTEPDAVIVHAAAGLGVTELLPILLADLQARGQRDPKALFGADRHVEFVLACLGRLLPWLGAEDAASVYAMLLANGASPAVDQPQARLPVAATLFALYARLPEALAAGYEAWFTDRGVRSQFAFTQRERLAALPADRAARVLRGIPAGADCEAELAPLYLTCPDALVAAWRTGTERVRASAVQVAFTVWQQDPARFVAALRDGRLPRELAAAAVYSLQLPLSSLAEALPERADAAWEPMLANGVVNATVGEPQADLAALRTLAEGCSAAVAFAACERLKALGDDGRAIAEPVLARHVRDDEVEDAAKAFAIAVRLGIDLPLEPTRCERIAKASWEGVAALAAADLRFRGADPASVEDPTVAALAIAISGRDVDEAVWRHLLGDDGLAARAVGGEPPLTATSRTALLRAVAKLRAWPNDLDRLVAYATAAAEPEVRAAAYAALASRDDTVTPFALWARAIEFDADPRVRAVGTSR